MSRYRRVVVGDSYRTDALCQFVADLIDKGDWPGIVFVRLQEHAAELAERLGGELDHEVPVVTTLHTDKVERDRLADRMRRRDPDVPVVVATGVWTTGLDIPVLSWIVQAGAGQAPIGQKQAAARADRLADGKEGYTVYDWQDVDVDWAREQAAERMRHYGQAGFSVEAVRPSSAEASDPDAARLARLLTLSVQRGDEPVAGGPSIQRPKPTAGEKALMLLYVLIGLSVIAASLAASC